MSKKQTEKLIGALILVLCTYIYTTYLSEPVNNFLNKINNNETIPVNSTRKVDKDIVVYFLDVGQADSILISNKGNYMLIDAGNNEDGPKLVKYFQAMGINKFDIVVGTHAHEDHIGGMDDIINNFEIGTFYMPDVVTTTATFEDVITALENKNLAFTTPEEDMQLTLNDAVFNVLHVGTNSSDLNNTSIILKMIYGNTSFLFTGDATSKVENEILDKDIRADVLKVGHHGSQYSTTPSFLKKVNPNYAVIEAGENNIYDHPKQVTLDKLNNSNVKVYRTDKDGTVVATSNGKSLIFTTMETDTDG